MNLPVHKPRVYKAIESHGMRLAKPGWFMYDGWITYHCQSWQDAMSKARRRTKGKPA